MIKLEKWVIKISFSHSNLVTLTTRNHLIYDEIKSSQIAEKTLQNSIYDGFVTILDNVMEWASQIKSIDVFYVNVTD